MGYPGRIKGGIWVESGVIGAETAENLCWGFGCREEGFFAKVSYYEMIGISSLVSHIKFYEIWLI